MSIFRDNFSLKLAALTLALALEFYFYSPDNFVIAEFRVPLDVQNVPASQMVVSPEPEMGTSSLSARVKVQGPGPLVREAQSSNVKFTVVVPQGVRDSFDIELRPEQLGFPGAVTVLELEPRALRLEFQPIVTLELPVNPVVEGRVASGYRLIGVKAVPEILTVTGPASVLDGVEKLFTQPLDVTDFRRSKRVDVPIVSVGKLVSTSKAVVELEVQVEPIMIERTFEPLVVQILGTEGKAVSLKPSRVSISVHGPENLITATDGPDIVLFVDAAPLKAGVHSVPVQVQLPPGVELLRSVPEKVSVTVAGK